MKKFFTTIAFLNIVFASYSQDELKKNFQRSIDILSSIKNEINYSQFEESDLGFQYQGKLYLDGHYYVPEQRREYDLNGQIVFMSNLTIINTSTLKSKGNSYDRSLIHSLDSLVIKNYGTDNIDRVSSKSLDNYHLFSPIMVLKLIDEQKQSLRLISKSSTEYRLGFNDSYGLSYFMTVNRKTHLPTEISYLSYDDVEGDIVHSVHFENYYDSLGYKFPTRITLKSDDQIESTFQCTYLDNLGSIVEGVSRSLNFDNSTKIIDLKSQFKIEKVSEKIYTIKLEDYNNKVLVYVNDQSISVFEAPINLNISRNLIEFITDYFPAKKIKNCFVSHHHPDHAGGVSAFFEIDSKVITTKGNRDYFNKLGNQKHSLNSNQIVQNSDANKMEFVNLNSSVKYLDGNLKVFEGGENSSHTNEYLFFYFSKEKILFVGDLVLFPNDYIKNQGKRAYSVYQIIKENKLDIDRIYTSWPVNKQKEYGTIEDLKLSIYKKYPNVK